jgi:flagellar biosynthesis/type III secretory pathway protein FliH
MKSFSKIRSNASHEKLKTWNPPELDVASAAYSESIQKDQVLAIFRNEEETNANNKGKRRQSALHPTEINQNFAAWQPGNLNHQPAVVRKAEWAFIKISGDSSDKPEKAQITKLISGGVTHRERFNPENEAPAILERACVQAEEIILAAQAEADHIVMQAQSEIDNQKKEGYQQGWNAARLEIEDALKATQIMVEEVGAWKTELMSQGEHILVEMLKEISRKMFGDGAELDTDALQTNLNRIMESAHGLGNLNIFLNPRDAKIMDPSWSEQQILISGGQVKIIPSSNITRGGCYVKGNMGTVDGRVETQLDAILKTFDETDTLAE